MSNKEKYRILDLGNTSLKIVDFQNDDVVFEKKFSWKEKEAIQKELENKKNKISILSSVVDEKRKDWVRNLAEPTVIFNSQTKLPISLENYKTVETLGVDRIANVVAANYYADTETALVIDIGTCITFDIIHKEKYEGGAISPGYAMRLKAMHYFTGALPLLELEDKMKLVGQSTKESMLSGVLNGIQAEIEGILAKYQQIYGTLTIFFTGGDHKRFDLELKNGIFADENLTVKGLYLILKHNA